MPAGPGLAARLGRLARILLGVVLILGGVLGFLPILGFWMLPLGVMVLAREVPAVARLVERLHRRWQRR